ncbi:MAG: hotdog fold thioesterase [Succinivibrionaceae bacterium]|nr:hotdog fold thioesterase [Succinivibrionaceae bacterium]
MIWKRSFTLEHLNDICGNTLISHLGIVFTGFGDDYMEARMPVDRRTCQPYGMLHGGASAALAETVGSIAGNMCCPEDKCCLGVDVNANHLKGVFSGMIRAVARPLHLGATTQVWSIRISSCESDDLICDARLTLAVHRRKKPVNAADRS